MAPGDQAVVSHLSADDVARQAGIHHEGLTLSDVDRRRTQLWSISVLLIAAVTVAIALFYLGQDYLPEAVRLENISSWVVVVLVSGLAFAFIVYIVEKELSLRRLT